jgi:hypothetical protein
MNISHYNSVHLLCLLRSENWQLVSWYRRSHDKGIFFSTTVQFTYFVYCDVKADSSSADRRRFGKWRFVIIVQFTYFVHFEVEVMVFLLLEFQSINACWEVQVAWFCSLLLLPNFDDTSFIYSEIIWQTNNSHHAYIQ